MSGGAIEDSELRNLMTRYQQADEGALEELVRRVSPLLLRYFAGLRTSREDADDLLQDCWIRIHRSRHTYRSSEPVLPWIYAIARHTRLDAYRKRQRMQAREVLVSSVPEDWLRTAPETAQEDRSFEQMIADLPETQREALVLLKVAGMSLEEAAKATSSSVGAVKQRVHRAYETLRRGLRKEV